METNEALESIYDIAHASKRIVALYFGGVDMAAELRVPNEYKNLIYARSRLVHAGASVGVDVIDCSSGGNYSEQIMELTPGYQVPFAKVIKSEAGILTGAVGLITETKHAEEILEKKEADAIFLGRALLRYPYWNLYSQENVEAWPLQYLRSFESFDKIKYVRE